VETGPRPVRSEGTEAGIKRFKNWLMSHAQELIAVVCLVAGTYMVVSALVRPL
jgi:hypothetical protein